MTHFEHKNYEYFYKLLKYLFLLLFRETSQAFQDKNLDLAKKLLIRMKYHTSIDNRLKKLKQDLGIVE